MQKATSSGRRLLPRILIVRDQRPRQASTWKQKRDSLLDFEVLILHTGLVCLNTVLVRVSRSFVRVLTLSRRTAIARSSGVRNQAFVGESGKKNLKHVDIKHKTDTSRKTLPVNDCSDYGE